MTLRVLVDDVPTVLARFALLLSRRDVELRGLSVHRLDSPGTAVLLVDLDADAAMVDHLCRRLTKMVNVVEVSILDKWTQCTTDHRELCDLHRV